MNRHNEDLAVISALLKGFYERKQPYRIYHGSTNSTRHSQFQRDQMVDTSGLTRVLGVNQAAKTAIVEPNVPMDSLVEATLKYGLVPPVVMEFPGITTGGGFSGTSGESSSFRYGFFDRTINSIEIVLANGEVVKASPSERPDLFYGAACSFGTLGVVTLLEVQLVEAKEFVELTYHPVRDVSEAIEKIKELTENSSIDYLDGILFSKTTGVVCAGRLTNKPLTGLTTQRFSRAIDPWFYLHSEDVTQRGSATQPFSETIPITDYLFRYDRGGFWVGYYAYQYFLCAFNFLTRWLLDYFMHTRVMYHALHKSGLSDAYVIQDVAVPYDAAPTFVSYLDVHFGHYPLWLCPLKLSGTSHGLLAKPEQSWAREEMLLNVGVWGPGPAQHQPFIDLNRALEREVNRLGGRKWLYAHTYYTEPEFWDIYHRDDYDVLRAKYHASHLPTIYDKVRLHPRPATGTSWPARLHHAFWNIWPLMGLYGVAATILGSRDYLLPKAKKPDEKHAHVE